MMEVGSFVGNAQKQFSAMLDTAAQGIAQSAKTAGPESLKLVQELFTSDIIELNSINQPDPVILPEAEFLDPISFFQNIFEALESPEFLEALSLPFQVFQNELSDLDQSMKQVDAQSFGLEQEKSAVSDLQSELSNQVGLYDQATLRTFESGLPKLTQSFQNTMPPSVDTGTQYLKDQLNNSLPGNYHYESKQQYGDRPMGSRLPAYGSQGKTLAEAELGVKFADVDVSGQGDWGSGYFKGEMFIGARGRVFGDVDWEKRNMYVGFEAEVGARAHYEGAYRTPTGPAGAEFGMAGDAFSGAQARGTAELSLNENAPRIALGGEAFEGSRAGLDLGTGLTIDGNRAVGGHYGVEAWNGVGGAINADLGIKDGNLRFDFSGGLALAIGAEVSFGFDIGFGDLFRSGKKIGEDFLNDVGNAAESVGKELETEVKNTAKDIADGAESAAKEAGKAVDKVISSIF